MTPQYILKQTRRERDMTLGQIAEMLDTSNQRVSQWEQGDAIPVERIRAWANEKRFPEWVHNMAWQMWLAHLEQQHTALGEQMDEVRQSIGIES